MAQTVPFVDYPAHYRSLESEIRALLDDVLFTRADLMMRGDLKEFESNIASFLGVKHAIGVNSCTDAIHLSLYAAGIGAGDEVITVAHTFVATIAAIVHSGATPVLIDIGEDDLMNVGLVEEAISPRTKAIIPVDLNGRICEMDKLMDIAGRHNLLVIEDSAQALGATFDGKKAGSFGLTGCFSFYPAKLLGAAGDGGLVSTNSDEMAEKIRLLRDHGRLTKEDIAFYGFNSRLDNLQAAILNLKLRYLPKWLERRRELAAMYHDGLSDLSLKLPVPPESDGRYYDVFQNYVIHSAERDRMVEHLTECGIEVLISWPKPVHYNESLGLKHFKLPVTEKLCKEVISLAMNTEISNKQVEYIISCVRSFYKG